MDKKHVVVKDVLKVFKVSDDGAKTATIMLKEEISFKNDVIRRLIKYYEVTQGAIAREKLGHHDGWGKVQVIVDDIEDRFDFEMMVKDLK